MSYARVYDFSIPAGGTVFMEVPGDYYKIISSTGNIGVRRDASNILQPMFAGRGEKGAKFNRLALSDLSSSTNTGSILIASDGAEMVDSKLQLVGSVQVRPEGASGNAKSNAALAANTAEQIFAPGANTNGVLLLSASFICTNNASSFPGMTLIAKAGAAPASNADGEVILTASNSMGAGTSTWEGGQLPKEQLITAGMGLYWIAGAVTVGTAQRAARWKVL